MSRISGLTEVQCYYHRRTVVLPCVNGNIAIQWEWSNFDPSQKLNQLTDYDKTLHHNYLCTLAKYLNVLEYE